MDPVAIPIAMTPLRERFPVVTQIGGERSDFAGQSFYVAWQQEPLNVPDAADIGGIFVDETMVGVPGPTPTTLGVQVAAPPDSSVQPGDALVFAWPVTNTGGRKDGYRMSLEQTANPPWTLTLDRDLVILDGFDNRQSVVLVNVPPGTSPDSNFVTLRAVSVTVPAITSSAVQVLRKGSGPPTGVGNPALRSVFSLSPARPNPFDRITTIRFVLPRAGDARLDVYDLSGRRIRTLAAGEHDAGPHVVTWDGRESGGSQAASGLYLVRLQAGAFTATRKVLLRN
jgi:hypothetical protein